MIINWFGQACLRIQTGGLNLLIDPFSPQIGLEMPRLKADALLITHNHYDHNFKDKVMGDYFLIDSAGEYEYKGINILGVESFHDNLQGKERGLNTIFRIDAEGIRLVHLGDLGQSELTLEQAEKIHNPDVLFIPVGGVYTIDANQAQKIIKQLGPKIIVPIHYFVKGLKFKLDPLEKFTKAIGQNNVKTEEKLVIRKSELNDAKQKLVVLSIS